MPPPGAVLDTASAGPLMTTAPATSARLSGSYAAAAAAATVGGLCGGLLPLLTGARVLPADYSAIGGGAAGGLQLAAAGSSLGVAGVVAGSNPAQQQQAVEVVGLDPNDLTAVRQVRTCVCVCVCVC